MATVRGRSAGLYFLDYSKRVYPHGSSGVQVLGLVDTTTTAFGLELEYTTS